MTLNTISIMQPWFHSDGLKVRLQVIQTNPIHRVVVLGGQALHWFVSAGDTETDVPVVPTASHGFGATAGNSGPVASCLR